MEGRILSKRYGEAYYQALDTQGALSAGAEDLKLLKEVLAATRLQEVLASPNVGGAEKLELVRGQFAGKLHPLTVRLIELLLEKRRANHLAEVVQGVIDLMDERAGIVDALCITAFELPAALVEKLHSHLEKRTGKRVRLSAKVEPALIGGITIRVADAYLDGSFKTLLGHMKEQLKAARVA